MIDLFVATTTSSPERKTIKESSLERKAAVPLKSEKPVMGQITKKNFISSNKLDSTSGKYFG